MNTQKPLPRVAVVVVHGVADQQPNESARQVAGLLLQVDRDRPDAWWNGTRVEEAPYSPFREAPVHVRTLPLVGFESCGRQPSTFYARSQDVRRLKTELTKDTPQRDVAPTDIEFAEQVLAGYQSQGNDETYQTICLTARRLEKDQPTADVHLYEMYWADLSRVGRGAVQILGELYQILFHVCTLGRHVINAAAIEHAQSRRWGLYAAVHRLAVGTITFPIAVFNILLVGMAVVILLCGVAMKLPAGPAGTWAPRADTIIIWGLWSMISVGLLGAVMLRQTPRRLVWWCLAPAVVGTALLAIGWIIDRAGHADRANPRAAALLALLAGGLVVGTMLGAYAKRRPGTGRLGLLAGTILAGLFLALVIWPGPGGRSIGVARGMLVFDVILKSLELTWGIMLLLLIATWAAGRLAVAEAKNIWRGAPPQDADRFGSAWWRAKQAEWTALLTLSMPYALFVLVTLILWAGVFAVVGKPVQDVHFRPVLAPAPITIKGYAESYLSGNAATMFAVLAVSVSLATVLMAWSFGPVVFAEVKPPQKPDDRALSLGQGRWLDHGFRLLKVAGRLVFYTLAVVYPLLFLYLLWWRKTPLPPVAAGFLRASGAILGASAVGLLAFRGRLDKLSLGFRPLVDVMLDVDNHLREFPRGRNPRSLITARYASLLRHLCQWRDGDRGYDAIVIIAHSQGTVVTADLFRLLRFHRHGIRRDDPELAPLLDGENPLPVDVFTMGCPLGQLYAVRFPHLYQWAYDGGGTPPAQDRKPDPAVLGFRRWINAFRAGDYVGRSLWSSDQCAYDPTSPKSVDLNTPTPKRAEFCLGAGAHTHYWDSTAPQVGWMLDALIARACKPPSGPAPAFAPVTHAV